MCTTGSTSVLTKCVLAFTDILKNLCRFHSVSSCILCVVVHASFFRDMELECFSFMLCCVNVSVYDYVFFFDPRRMIINLVGFVIF